MLVITPGDVLALLLFVFFVTVLALNKKAGGS